MCRKPPKVRAEHGRVLLLKGTSNSISPLAVGRHEQHVETVDPVSPKMVQIDLPIRHLRVPKAFPLGQLTGTGAAVAVPAFHFQVKCGPPAPVIQQEGGVGRAGDPRLIRKCGVQAIMFGGSGSSALITSPSLNQASTVTSVCPAIAASNTMWNSQLPWREPVASRVEGQSACREMNRRPSLRPDTRDPRRSARRRCQGAVADTGHQRRVLPDQAFFH